LSSYFKNRAKLSHVLKLAFEPVTVVYDMSVNIQQRPVRYRIFLISFCRTQYHKLRLIRMMDFRSQFIFRKFNACDIWTCFRNQVKITVVLDRSQIIAFSKISHWISRCNCVYHKVGNTDYQHNYLLCISKEQHGYMFRLLGGYFEAFKVHEIKITIAMLFCIVECIRLVVC
jgi:hypothetical protein